MVTRKDVALRANVSVAAVSRVLNNCGYVAEEKRKVILETARELGYTPNPVAISLKQSKTRQILFYMQNTSNSYYMELYAGMLAYANTRDYLVLISGSMALERIATLMIDGVIFSATQFLQEDIKKYLRIPFVLASHGEEVPKELHSVATDTGEAVEQAVGYLRKRGHDKIAFASFETPADNRRARAYHAALTPVLGKQCNAYHLSVPIPQTSDPSLNLFDIGVKAADLFQERALDATAVICYNDDIAIGFNHQIQARGLRVPQDVSIVGLDGILVGSYMVPALTTFDINPFHRGQKTAEMLINLIEGDPTESKLQLSYSLREGASVCDRFPKGP